MELLDAESPRVRHSAAKDILDRTMGKTHDNEGSPGVVIDAERMNLLMVALRESQGECDE